MLNARSPTLLPDCNIDEESEVDTEYISLTVSGALLACTGVEAADDPKIRFGVLSHEGTPTLDQRLELGSLVNEDITLGSIDEVVVVDGGYVCSGPDRELVEGFVSWSTCVVEVGDDKGRKPPFGEVVSGTKELFLWDMYVKSSWLTCDSGAVFTRDKEIPSENGLSNDDNLKPGCEALVE